MDSLFDAATVACERGDSTTDFEPALARLLRHLETHPECRAAAERRFIDGIRGGTLGWEVVSYCMHALRWDSVRREALRLLEGSAAPSVERALHHIVESFEDDWEDADMYERYRSNP